MIIGVFGLSGAGKSSLVKDFVRTNSGFVGVSASALIREGGGVVSYDGLNNAQVEHNQDLLVRRFCDFKDKYQDLSVLIELHNIIEMPGRAVIVKKRVFRDLELDAGYFLAVAPDQILNYRKNDGDRIRSAVTVEEVGIFQQIAIDGFVEMMEEFQLPHAISWRNHLNELVDFIDRSRLGG